MMGLTISDLPGFNAFFNGVSTICILLGWWFIRNENKKAHIAMMVSALVASTIFLAGYSIYHISKGAAVTKFEETGMIRATYMFILFTHIVLAFTVLPLVGMTVVPALRSRFDRHRRIGRWAMPVWLYVSFTGVIVYLMLYKWFPPSSLGS